MVLITPQFAAVVAAISISGVNAAALPRAQAGAQVRLSVNSPHKVPRSVPTAKLPATVMAKMQTTAGKHVAGDHHRDEKSGKGKKKNHKRRLDIQAKVASNLVNADGNNNVLDAKLNIADHNTKRDHDHHHHHHHGHKRSASTRALVDADVTVHVADNHSSNDHGHSHDHSHHHHHGKRMDNLTLRGKEVYKRDHDHDHDHGDHDHDHDHHHKRAVINIANNRHSTTYKYGPAHGSLVHLEIGKREGKAQEKRSPFLGQPHGPVGGSLKYLASVVGRSEKESRDHDHHHHHHHHHDRRAETEGVEGVVNIVSTVVGSGPATIASLLLSSDPNSNNAFVLNASNSSATHVFLVPANTTSAAAGTTDGSIPVALHVPVYAPEKAEMVDYCMTYDPNPPTPAPLAAQPCTDTITDHASQVFSYTPSSGVIVPMWTVAPTSTDPSAASEDDSTTTESASASTSATASTSTADASMTDAPTMTSTSMATDSATSAPLTTTASAAQEKRSAAAYLVQGVAASATDDAPCDDAVQSASMDPSAAGNDTASVASVTPQDVILVFVPSDAAAILPSSIDTPTTSTFSPAPNQSDDGNVGGGPSTSSIDTSSADEQDAQDDGDSDDEGDNASSASMPSTDPNGSSTDSTSTDSSTDDGSVDNAETFTEEEASPNELGF